MTKLNITNSKLFDNLLELDFNGVIYDLHNDFELQKINYSSSNNTILLDFVEIGKKNSIIISFSEVIIVNLNIPFNKENPTLDNLHRGRHEVDNALYDEFEGRKCFYIEFYNEGDISLLCKEANASISDNIKVLNIGDKK